MEADVALPAGFEEGLRRKEVRFPRCEACGKFHWYALDRCPHCLSDKIAWLPVKGEATVFSTTTVRHPFDPAFRDPVPYTVALVNFSDAPGVRFVSILVGPDAEKIPIGAVLEPVFELEGKPPRVLFRAKLSA